METIQNPQKENDVNKLKVIDFWASWCGPCKALSPIIDSIATEYGDFIDLQKVEIDNPINKSIVDKYQVQSIPTVVFEKQGTEVARLTGLRPREAYSEIIKQNIPREL